MLWGAPSWLIGEVHPGLHHRVISQGLVTLHPFSVAWTMINQMTTIVHHLVIVDVGFRKLHREMGPIIFFLVFRALESR